MSIAPVPSIIPAAAESAPVIKADPDWEDMSRDTPAGPPPDAGETTPEAPEEPLIINGIDAAWLRDSYAVLTGGRTKLWGKAQIAEWLRARGGVGERLTDMVAGISPEDARLFCAEITARMAAA